VLYDNINDCDNAIKSYKKFLKIVSRNKDAIGVCLGFNHIGVALHLSGQYREAAEHHRRHKDAAIHLNSTRQSFRSQILALCNEGLAHREYGNLETAEACHKEALEISKEIHDKGGEALAAGQLGLDSIKLRTESRLEFGRKNLERHMDLCSATLRGEEGFDSSHSKDPRNISNAFHQLGE
jgi:tetratricopeptide (TPR) repeat protein